MAKTNLAPDRVDPFVSDLQRIAVVLGHEDSWGAGTTIRLQYRA